MQYAFEKESLTVRLKVVEKNIRFYINCLALWMMKVV